MPIKTRRPGPTMLHIYDDRFQEDNDLFMSIEKRSDGAWEMNAISGPSSSTNISICSSAQEAVDLAVEHFVNAVEELDSVAGSIEGGT